MEPVGSGSYGTVWRAKNTFLSSKRWRTSSKNGPPAPQTPRMNASNECGSSLIHKDDSDGPNKGKKVNSDFHFKILKLNGRSKSVAIKVISKDANYSIEGRTKLAREMSILKTLDHPLLTELFFFDEDEHYFYLAMEYLENGSLLDLINNDINFNILNDNSKLTSFDSSSSSSSAYSFEFNKQEIFNKKDDQKVGNDQFIPKTNNIINTTNSTSTNTNNNTNSNIKDVSDDQNGFKNLIITKGLDQQHNIRKGGLFQKSMKNDKNEFNNFESNSESGVNENENDNENESIEDEAMRFSINNQMNGNNINFLNERLIKKLFVQLIIAVDFLHNEQHIAHRDIKAENVLLDKYNNIRIIDFGLSAIIHDDNDSLTTTVGSVAYSAPEMLLKKPYSRSADIWSIGVLLYAMATSHLPFVDNDQNTICNLILHKEIELPNNLSKSLKDLIRRMLVKDPRKRISLREIISHQWFPIKQYNLLKEFINDHFRKIDDIDLELDKEIVETMENDCHLDCEPLSQLLFVQEIDEVSSTYKELRKTKVCEELNLFYKLYREEIENEFLEFQQNEVNMSNSCFDKSFPKSRSLATLNMSPLFAFNIINDPVFNNIETINNSNNSNNSNSNNNNSNDNITTSINNVTTSNFDFFDSNCNDDTVVMNINPASVQTAPNESVSKGLQIPNYSFNDSNNNNNNNNSNTVGGRLSASVSSATIRKFPKQLLRSGTSNLLFTPNERSNGTNTKIVPKTFVTRPRIPVILRGPKEEV